MLRKTLLVHQQWRAGLSFPMVEKSLFLLSRIYFAARERFTIAVVFFAG